MVTVVVCLGWIASVCLHEFGHAIVAYWGGDTSVKEKGYLTLNPLRYTDLNLSLVMPLIFLLLGGIALPGAAVYIDHSRLRHRGWQSAVSAAGPLASLLVAGLLTIPFWLNLPVNDHWLWAALAFLVVLQIDVTILNLLPIPPLDGYGIIEPWLPAPLKQQFNQFGRYGIWFVFGLFWFVPQFNQSLWRLVFAISDRFHVPGELVIQGSEQFRQGTGGLVVVAVAIVLLVRRFNRKPFQVWYERATALSKARKYEAAIAACDQAIALKPDLSPAWQLRGTGLAALKRYDDALESLERAIQLQPGDPGNWLAKSLVLSGLKNYDAAIAACDQALQADPKSGYAWYNKACFYAVQGQIDKALESLARSLELDFYRFRSHARTDPDLAPLRETEQFQQLIAGR